MNKLKLLRIKAKRWCLGLRPGDMFSAYGKGEYVDVLKERGGIIEIVSHRDTPVSQRGTILLIPYQPNHGVMVEYRDDKGKTWWRDLMSYDDFYKEFSKGYEKTQEEPTK